MPIKNAAKKLVRKVKADNERGARQGLLEDLFYDFNRNRTVIYKMNFIRGLFFGFGSVLGGTVLIALLAWILSFFIELPGIGQPVEKIQQTIQTDRQ